MGHYDVDKSPYNGKTRMIKDRSKDDEKRDPNGGVCWVHNGRVSIMENKGWRTEAPRKEDKKPKQSKPKDKKKE